MKLLPLSIGIAFLATACAQSSKDESMAQSGQINCATAEADLRVLRNEQDHATDQLQAGDSLMTPSGLVTEPEFSAQPMTATNYRDYLGDRISRIEQTCGL